MMSNNIQAIKRAGLAGLLLAAMAPGMSKSDTVTDLLDIYRSKGVKEFSATRGHELWKQTFVDSKSGQKRSCTTCHTSNLRKAGKHARTGKTIQPMAPSANSKRLTDHRKIQKWFRRNCKWTLGRACSPQEKGDILTYLSQQ